MHVTFATAVVLLISGTNLCGLAYALSLNGQEEPNTQLTRMQLTWAAPLSMILAFVSQALYLVFLAAWMFHWLRFNPGNPTIERAYQAGLALSFLGLFTALVGTGTRRWISFIVSIATAFLWILAAVASIAI